MNRRDFLKLLGVGAATVLVEEPIRKMWFVPSSAPVGSRVERPMRLVNTVTGESVGFGSVDVQFGDQPPVYFDLAEANREWAGFNLSREPIVIPDDLASNAPVGSRAERVYWSKVDDPAHVPPLDEPIVLPDDLASIVAEEVPRGRPFNFPVRLLDYSRYDFECSPYDVLVAQPGHEPTLLPHGTKVEYLTMNSDEWFYRDLADVQIDPELHRQLHIEAAKRYREEHGRNYWDPPEFAVEARRQEERDLHENPLWNQTHRSVDRRGNPDLSVFRDLHPEKCDEIARLWESTYDPELMRMVLPRTRRDG